MTEHCVICGTPVHHSKSTCEDPKCRNSCKSIKIHDSHETNGKSTRYHPTANYPDVVNCGIPSWSVLRNPVNPFVNLA